MARRIWAPPEYWQQYLSCLVMHVGAPFVPLIFELVLTGAIETKSWALFVAMYAMAIGITSSSKLQFGLTFVVGIFFACFFGAVSKGALPVPTVGRMESVAMWVVGAIVVIHAAERYNRHVVDRAPFWEFGKNDDQAPAAPASVFQPEAKR